ncbi:MAG: hypothetical protein LLF94_04150 [Chlamydiales bacterium]|nr:hypothetical protein [Chlamydiales bacterium]
MRQILAGQNIIIGLSDEVRLDMGKDMPTANDVFEYFTTNMAESIKDKNWAAGQQRMREVLEKPLRMLLADSTAPKDTNDYFSKNFDAIARVLPRGVKLPAKLEYSPNLFINNYKIGTNKHALHRLPESCLLAIGTGTSTRYVMISLEDASQLKKALAKEMPQPPKRLALYSLDAKLMVSSGNDADATFLEEIKKITPLAKLAAGKVKFSKTDIANLKASLDAQPNKKSYAANIRKMYESTLKYLPNSKSKYQNSPIQHLLTSYET